MINMILFEEPRVSLRDAGPVRLLARHNGKYQRPIMAYAVDFRLEDNPHVPNDAMRINATWIARHPLDDLYIIYDGALVASRATPEETFRHWLPDWRRLQARSPRPKRLITLPDRGDAAWWEWVEALDADYNLIKAAKQPRPGDATPEQVDEAPQLCAAGLAERLDRIFHSR